jgi:hypothetical protein
MSLVYRPQEIATGAVYAAASCLQLPPLNVTPPDDKGFSTFFNMTAERLQGEAAGGQDSVLVLWSVCSATCGTLV